MNTNNALILENVKANWQDKKAIHSLTPFTLLDYPNKTACILWFAGCNMKCDYCYNPEIVFGKGQLSFSEIFSFLKTRRNLLDAVVLSGGECLIHQNIIPFISAIKEMGFLVKIDTNGSKPKILHSLLSQNLIDYVAMDFKGPKEKFEKIAHLDAYSSFKECLKLLVSCHSIPFEIRTTYHSNLLNPADILTMLEDLTANGYSNNFYIQNYRNYQNTIKPLPDSSALHPNDFSPNMTKIIFR